MTSQIENQNFSRAEVISVLSQFRQAWEQALGDQSLIEAEASIGLVLADIAISLGLNRQEQENVLGVSLRREYFRAIRACKY